MRVEIELGALDPRLKLAPCAHITPYLPPHARLWGATRIGVRCDEGARWSVYLPVRIKVFARASTITQDLPAGTVLRPRTSARPRLRPRLAARCATCGTLPADRACATAVRRARDVDPRRQEKSVQRGHSCRARRCGPHPTGANCGGSYGEMRVQAASRRRGSRLPGRSMRTPGSLDVTRGGGGGGASLRPTRGRAPSVGGVDLGPATWPRRALPVPPALSEAGSGHVDGVGRCNRFTARRAAQARVRWREMRRVAPAYRAQVGEGGFHNGPTTRSGGLVRSARGPSRERPPCNASPTRSTSRPRR